MQSTVGVVGDRDVELLVYRAAVLRIRALQDRDNAFDLLDERADLFARHAPVAASAAELELGGPAFELHLLDPARHDRRVGTGLQRLAVPGELGVALPELAPGRDLERFVGRVGPEGGLDRRAGGVDLFVGEQAGQPFVDGREDRRLLDEAESLPGRIEDLEREMDELPTKIEIERAARDQANEFHADRQSADAERVRQALDDDARIRGEHSAEQPSQLLTDHLGPVPDGPAARERWVAAAGRIAQHRALWDLPETTLVGSLPPLGQPDYSTTYYAANRAIADLGAAVDLPRSTPERAAPGLSL